MATDADKPGIGTTTGQSNHAQVQVAAPEQVRTVHIRGEDGEVYEGPLPPMELIEVPETEGGTKSVRIRWLSALGYTVNEISKGLNVRYQMVRNIVTTTPKRAAREDMPQLIVVYKPEVDELSDALDGALEKSLLAARKERIQEAKDAKQGDREAWEGGQDE